MRVTICFALTVLLAACVHSPKAPEIVSLENEYEISAIIEETWSGKVVQADLLKRAESFCQEKNLSFERVEIKSWDEKRFNYANAKIKFKCVK